MEDVWRGTVALETLGCKLNQAESERLAWQLAAAGYKLVSAGDKADIYILNTCTVTHIADRKSRHLLRLAHRRNPDAFIIAAGCYAQRAPEILAQIEGIDLVLGNDEKMHLAEMLTVRGNTVSAGSCHRSGLSIAHPVLRSRSFVKIQDGCNSHCAYCIVPRVRGREHCLAPKRIIGEIQDRVAAGYKEVVLTGTKVGSYSHDGVDLSGLLKRILAETGIERLRLSSLQPQEISPDLLHLWVDSRLCRHFHLPLQSGSGAVLKRMKRRYSISDYREAVRQIREAVPEVAITTDIIVGFPGESEEEFLESYHFCEEIGFASIHVFPYSLRSGTVAADMSQQTPDKLKRERSLIMLRLAQRSAQNFRWRFLAHTAMVLWEREVDGKDKAWAGLTDNYIRAFTTTERRLTNKLVPAQLIDMHPQGMWARLPY